MNTSDIKQLFINKFNNGEFIVDKTGVKTIEIIGASFIADKDVIFGTVNKDYIKREIEWYMSQSLNVNDIPGETPEIWKKISDKNGKINSNYGYLINSNANYNQLVHVYHELNDNPNSRRAIMIYTRPSMHLEYNDNGMDDFICTNAVQYVIRDNMLHAIVQMRSNDIVFGYKNDYAWQKHILKVLSTMLEKEPGSITWQVGSLHMYERHFKFINE